MLSPYVLKPDRYSSHAQIAAWLKARRLRSASSDTYAVLDVGCAGGFLGHWLAADEFYLMGVDNNQVYLNDLNANYRQKILADIELYPALNLDRQPDALVLADVLEHCRHPVEVLHYLCKTYLRPGADVIISVPNVTHWYVRLSLLLGRFDYADRGLLDRTHLRFFTLESASDFCAQNQIVVEEVRVTPTPLPLINPIFGNGGLLYGLHALNGRLTHLFRHLLGYQFIFMGTYQPHTLLDAGEE